MVRPDNTNAAHGGGLKRNNAFDSRLGYQLALDGTHGNPASARLICVSAEFTSILETTKAIATRKCSVIITGETGTGKEMVARKIHAYSDRKHKVFVPVDCTTLTGQLFESQLFGHTKGAFTGAVDSTLGFFRAADGGTIFLDEISEIPLDLQAKLLRVLQQSSVTPLGSTKTHPIDVRVICATNKELKQLVKENKFRDDLYYRLNVVTLELPPLRQRRADILPMAEYFLCSQADFYAEPRKVLANETKKLLVEYQWPGNVRQLANAMERAYVMTPGKEIYPVALPAEIILADTSTEQPALLTIEAAQRKLVSQALEMTGGRKLAAAKILGLERRKLNRLLQKFRIRTSDSPDNAAKS